MAPLLGSPPAIRQAPTPTPAPAPTPMSKTTRGAKLVSLAIPILLLLLTAIAVYAYSRIGFLSLPIPKALALSTLVLPLITGVSTRAVNSLIRRSWLSLPLLAIIGFQLMYETVVATLALTHMIPPSTLTCGLDTNWQKLYQVKDADGIRAIQDTLKCCGFLTVKDRAFPFGKPSTCAQDFGRSQSCFGPWREAEQVTAGLLLLVAVVVFLLKVLTIVALLTRSSWAASRWAQPFLPNRDEVEEDPEEEHGGVMRWLIEDSANGDSLTDDASDRPSPRRDLEAAPVAPGPRVQPSQLLDEDNEWREERADRWT